jgi:HK97 family phage portal protein
MTFFGRLVGIGPSAPSAMEYGLDPSNASNPKNWLLDIMGGLMTSTGLRITPELAMTVPGVAACVNVLSEDLAKVPLNIYKRTSDGRRELARDHPLFSLIHSSPLPWMTSFDWRRAMISNAMIRGNSYTRIFRNRRGEVVKLQLQRPGSVMTKWAPVDGEPFYDINHEDGSSRIGYQEVAHIRYRADPLAGRYGGLLGMSPISRHAETIALAIAAEKFAAAFFRNGARPSAVIEMDAKLPNDAVGNRIRDGLERAYSGVDNAFKIAVLELGMKLKPFSFSNADSQLIEVRKEAALAIAMMFSIPPHKIGILDKATFSNIEHQAIEYVTGPVSGLARSIESSLTLSCLTQQEQKDYFIEHDLNGLLRGDLASRYRAYAIGRQWGWLSANDVRTTENLNPIVGGDGDAYLTPVNMAVDGQNPNQDQNANPSTPPGRTTGSRAESFSYDAE